MSCEKCAEKEKERDTFKAQWEHSARARFTDAESAEASLAELRKRMEIARLALEKAEHGLIVTHNLDASDDPERGFLNAFVIDNGAEMKAVEEALALIGRSSGPGPAPVDENGCRHVDGICAKIGFPGHVKPEDF